MIATLGHAIKKLFVLSILFTSLSSGHGAPFQNLDFEAANTNNVWNIFPNLGALAGFGSTADLLPGWTMVYDGQPLGILGLNVTPIGSGGWVGIFSRQFIEYFENQTGSPGAQNPQNLSLVLSGDYLFYMQTDVHPLFLSQVGDIPKDARLLQLDVLWQLFFSLGYLRTFLNGTEIINGDISAFAGEENVTLEFEIGSSPSANERPRFALDNISFIVPKPPFVESDFNGDGVPDVVFEHQDGSLGVWFMNKGPDLISASFFNPIAVADPRWHIVGSGSFTETNKTDLLFQHEDGSLAVWLMDRTNLVSAALLNPSQPGEGWKVVGTGDMNHDGKKDIVFQHTDGTLAVWYMDGINLVTGTLLNPNKPGDSGWRVVGTAHLTSAGNTDLIFQHTDGSLAAWYMDGTNLVRGALLNPSVPGQEGWRVASTLDLNQDGKTDLLFQHEDGTLAVWIMDGINLISGQLLNPENPGTGWRVVGPR